MLNSQKRRLASHHTFSYVVCKPNMPVYVLKRLWPDIRLYEHVGKPKEWLLAVVEESVLPGKRLESATEMHTLYR